MHLGQLTMVGFDGFEANDHIKRMIRDHRVGGIILFRRNLGSPQQVAALTRQLQEINAEYSDIPLLIALDYESDMARRFDGGLTPLPPAMLYKKHGNPNDCLAIHYAAGQELRAMGVNLNLAPVLDVNSNPDNPVIGMRSFGDTLYDVETYGLAALNGLKEAGILTCAKHFPGHGDTSMDSHHLLPSVPHPRSRIEALELVPFAKAFTGNVDTLMTAHVKFPAFEPDDLPATLSRRVLTELLRKQMGFRGVVLTDCLEMAAILEHYGIDKAAPMALAAGADIVLISHREQNQLAAIQAIQHAVSSGGIAGDVIEAAIERVLALKKKIHRKQPSLDTLVSPSNLALSEHIYRGGIYQAGEIKPLDSKRPVLLISFNIRKYSEIDQFSLGSRPMLHEDLLPHFATTGFSVSEIALPPTPEKAQIEEALAKIAEFDQVVIQSFDACLFAAQREIIQRVPSDKLWLLAGCLPYDLDLVETANARLSVCSNRPWAQRILLSKIGVPVTPSFL
jgi:beta-N-acetylhexosaminidase